MVQDQIQEALVDLAVEEAKAGEGTLKELKDVTSELEGMVPKGEGTMKLMSSAGKIPVWNRHTGRQGEILTDQLRFQLSKRFPARHPMAGERVYSLKPVDKPAGLKLKCWLHPDHEKRPWLNSIGLTEKSCLTDGIPTEYAVTTHMRKRHPGAYALILDEKTRAEKRQALELQQQQLEALQRIGGGSSQKIFTCDVGDCTRFFDSPQGLKLHKTKEHKDA